MKSMKPKINLYLALPLSTLANSLRTGWSVISNANVILKTM